MTIKDYKEDLPKTNTELYLIPVGDNTDACLEIAHQLRNNGVNVDIELRKSKKMKASITYAVEQGIPFVGFIGDDEVESNKVTLKYLPTGKQEDPIPVDMADKAIRHALYDTTIF